MIPSLLPLLVKNDFIFVSDLGRLASVSSMFHRYICTDADEELWAHCSSRNGKALP